MKDSLGRENRTLPDYICPSCGNTFRPPRARSKYCSQRCQWDNNTSGNRNPDEIWWTTTKGYIEGKVWIDGKRHQVKQHRWVMEIHLGRVLELHEDIHHINGDKADNRLKNLRLMNHGAHSTHHNLKRAKAKGE